MNASIEPIAKGQKLQNAENSGYIEAKEKQQPLSMYYPYVFEFAIKAGLIKNGMLVQPPIEPSTTELIAAFSRAAVLHMVGTLGCHLLISFCLAAFPQFICEIDL